MRIRRATPPFAFRAGGHPRADEVKAGHEHGWTPVVSPKWGTYQLFDIEPFVEMGLPARIAVRPPETCFGPTSFRYQRPHFP